MKNLIYISILLIAFSSCIGKKNVTKTHRVITREIDTLVTIPGISASFIPESKDSVERLFDRETGIVVTIYRDDYPESVNGKIVTGIDVETPDRDIPVKMNERVEDDIKEKEVEGVPWYYQYALYTVLTIIVIFIIRFLISRFLPGIKIL